jgi:sugar phosphate isomerase/epimerase
VVYNPITLLKVREAVGEEIGANCDLSHLFWQGCNPVEAIHFLESRK